MTKITRPCVAIFSFDGITFVSHSWLQTYDLGVAGRSRITPFELASDRLNHRAGQGLPFTLERALPHCGAGRCVKRTASGRIAWSEMGGRELREIGTERHNHWPGALFRAHLKPALEAAEIPGNIGWHALRHTFGTLMKANGERR